MISHRTKRLIEYAQRYADNDMPSEQKYSPQQLDHWIKAVVELSADRQPWYIRILSLIGWHPVRPLVRSH